MLRNILLALMLLAAIIFLPSMAYKVGAKTTAYNIAKQCAIDNTFTEHGNEFHCSDFDDYRGN